jgi:hypothetical protein
VCRTRKSQAREMRKDVSVAALKKVMEGEQRVGKIQGL